MTFLPALTGRGARRLTLAGSLCLSLATTVAAATISVRIDGSGDAATLQGGVDLAAAGDTVLVGPGTYVGPGNREVDFHGVDLVMRSSAGPDSTIIDCESAGRAIHLHSGETIAAMIEGVTIRNGWGDLSNPGSAVNVDGASISIHDCVIEDNTVHAVNLSGSSASEILRTVFRNNGEPNSGSAGAVACFSGGPLLVADCLFRGNRGNRGAGVRIQGGTSSAEIRDCEFIDNQAGGGGARGGGIFLSTPAEVLIERVSLSESVRAGVWLQSAVPETDVTVRECDFTGNDWGVVIETSRMTIEDCRFLASTKAGVDVGPSSGPTVVRRCLLTGNGSGPYIERSAVHAYGYPIDLSIENCTIADNPGRGIFSRNGFGTVDISVSRTIIATSGIGSGIDCDPENPPEVLVTCSNLAGNADGDAPTCLAASSDYFTGDPLFCDAQAGDYSLHANSACLPENSPCGELVGLYGAGCSAAGTTVAYWRFEAGADTTAWDSSGFDNHGALVHGTAFDPGVPVDPIPATGEENLWSLRLDGEDDAVEIPDAPSLRPATGLTVEAYIRPINDAWVILGKQISHVCCANSFQLQLAFGQLYFTLSDAGAGEHNISAAFDRFDVWTHVAGTWDGATMRLFVDGCEVAAAPYNGGIGYDANPVIIGADDDGSGGGANCCYFEGQIDEVRISNTALASDQFLNGGCGVVAVDPPAPGVGAGALILGRPYPIPFDQELSVPFELGRSMPVRISVVDVTGRRVALLTDAVWSTGAHVVRWSGRDAHGGRAASGCYWIRVETAGEQRVLRAQLIR